MDARINQPGRHLSKQEWLVMAEESAFEVLAEKGYVFDRVTHLEGLGLQLAEVSAPASFDISEVRAQVFSMSSAATSHTSMSTTSIRRVYPRPLQPPGTSPRGRHEFPPGSGRIVAAPWHD